MRGADSYLNLRGDILIITQAHLVHSVQGKSCQAADCSTASEVAIKRRIISARDGRSGWRRRHLSRQGRSSSVNQT
jgi:hypothetical protein